MEIAVLSDFLPSNFSRILTISFPGKTCLAAYWTLQSVRLNRAEQWKTCPYIPVLLLSVVLFFNTSADIGVCVTDAGRPYC